MGPLPEAAMFLPLLTIMVAQTVSVFAGMSGLAVVLMWIGWPTGANGRECSNHPGRFGSGQYNSLRLQPRRLEFLSLSPACSLLRSLSFSCYSLNGITRTKSRAFWRNCGSFRRFIDALREPVLIVCSVNSMDVGCPAVKSKSIVWFLSSSELSKFSLRTLWIFGSILIEHKYKLPVLFGIVHSYGGD